MKRWLKALAPMAVMLTFLGDDCSGTYVEDPSFRLWTDDKTLAAWEVTIGEIRKAPTWDESDPGVEFVQTPTEIAQTLKWNSDCVQVTVMGKVAADADLDIGTSTNTFRVPALDWSSHVAYVAIPGRTFPVDAGDGGADVYLSPTLRIRKNGPGEVVLAKVEVRGAAGCAPSTYGK